MYSSVHTHKSLQKRWLSKSCARHNLFPLYHSILTLHLQYACTNKFLKQLILYKYFNFSIAIRELLISNYLQRQLVNHWMKFHSSIMRFYQNYDRNNRFPFIYNPLKYLSKTQNGVIIIFSHPLYLLQSIRNLLRCGHNNSHNYSFITIGWMQTAIIVFRQWDIWQQVGSLLIEK